MPNRPSLLSRKDRRQVRKLNRQQEHDVALQYGRDNFSPARLKAGDFFSDIGTIAVESAKQVGQGQIPIVGNVVNMPSILKPIAPRISTQTYETNRSATMGEKVLYTASNVAKGANAYMAGEVGGALLGKAVGKIPLMKRSGKAIERTMPEKEFVSEVDWAKWNKEIPDNKALMQEYNTIEQTAKANGTWMKNSDGTVFQGTPEQFVQQNSKNFKKSFPEGYNEVWRGANNDPFIDRDGTAIFTANKDLANRYVGISDINEFVNPNTENSLVPGRNLFDLAHKKSTNSVELNNLGRDWQSINLREPDLVVNDLKSNINSLETQIEKQKKWLDTGVQNKDGSWSFPDSDFVYSDDLYKKGTSNTQEMVDYMKRRLKDKDNLVKNRPGLKKMRDELGPTTVSDDIAKYVEKNDLDYVKVSEVDDSGLGDVSIVNHKKGNYLKSLVGNNGIFDMTNPNIYKSLAPLLGASAIAKPKRKKKNNGNR